MSYEVADGGEIPNLGERKCLMLTPGCHFPKKIIFQVADVHKPLLSAQTNNENQTICRNKRVNTIAP